MRRSRSRRSTRRSRSTRRNHRGGFAPLRPVTLTNTQPIAQRMPNFTTPRTSFTAPTMDMNAAKAALQRLIFNKN